MIILALLVVVGLVAGSRYIRAAYAAELREVEAECILLEARADRERFNANRDLARAIAAALKE